MLTLLFLRPFVVSTLRRLAMRFVVILRQQFLELSACQTNMRPVQGSKERTSFGLVTLSWKSQPDAGSESSRKHDE